MNAVKQTGTPVAIFSLEMMAQELSGRILAGEAKVDSKKLRMKTLQDQDLKKIGGAVNRLSNMPVYINDSGSVTVMDINSECRKIKAESGLALVILDYIQLLRPANAAVPREGQISEISRYLKQMAKELECPVIALSQLNRGVETRTDKRPQVADLRESGALEQDADIVILIYRDEIYNPDTTKEPGIAEIIVGKNRSGETGTIKLSWQGPYYSFENIESKSLPPQNPNIKNPHVDFRS
jgi:replicative DNA helicase